MVEAFVHGACLDHLCLFRELGLQLRCGCYFYFNLADSVFLRFCCYFSLSMHSLLRTFQQLLRHRLCLRDCPPPTSPMLVPYLCATDVCLKRSISRHQLLLHAASLACTNAAIEQSSSID